MLRVESRVKLKDDYNGYFKDLKGTIMTVMQVFKAEPRSGESEKVTLLEITEIHLISVNNLVEVKDETIS